MSFNKNILTEIGNNQKNRKNSTFLQLTYIFK